MAQDKQCPNHDGDNGGNPEVPPNAMPRDPQGRPGAIPVWSGFGPDPHEVMYVTPEDVEGIEVPDILKIDDEEYDAALFGAGAQRPADTARVAIRDGRFEARPQHFPRDRVFERPVDDVPLEPTTAIPYRDLDDPSLADSAEPWEIALHPGGVLRTKLATEQVGKEPPEEIFDDLMPTPTPPRVPDASIPWEILLHPRGVFFHRREGTTSPKE